MSPLRIHVVLVTDRGVSTTPLPGASRIVIGRDPSLDIVVADGSVSRRHAILRRTPAGFTIEDLGSRNGTWLDGRQLSKGERAPVSVGRRVRIGAVDLELEAEAVWPDDPTRSLTEPDGPIVVDAKMRELIERTIQVAASDLPVLVLGETGTGKEVLSRLVHDRSKRESRSFVVLNCGALPEALLESELFGHVKGAFTDARDSKPGLFEVADGGTIFLDEIGEMSLATQAKLLRTLESGEIRPVGGLRDKRVDVRLVAATNQNLEAQIREGTFRSDLYFRIAGFVVRLPPLRERRSEIVPLARHLAAEFARQCKMTFAGFTPAAERALSESDLPGNARELRNTVARGVVLARGAKIDRAHLVDPGSIDAGAPELPAAAAVNWREERDRVERAQILAALERTQGNRTRAAELLGMPRRTFVYKLAAHGLGREPPAER